MSDILATDAPSPATLVIRLATTQSRLSIAIAALHRLAVWSDGPVTTRTDEPRAAGIARETLIGLGEVPPESVAQPTSCTCGDECACHLPWPGDCTRACEPVGFVQSHRRQDHER